MKQFSSILFSLVLAMGTVSFAQSNVPYDPSVEKDKLEYQKQKDKESEQKSADRESKQECATASKDYTEAMKKNPCTDAPSAAACQQKINECVSNTAIATGSTTSPLDLGNDELNGLSSQVLELLKAKNATDQQTTPGFLPDRSCYKKIKSTDKEVKKDRAAKMKELKKDIEDETKKINEANEKLKKETNEVKVEQQKLQAETTKAIQKLDVEKREKLTKMNEDLQKAGTDIRKQTTEIVKIKQAMEKMKFENQKTLTSYTEDKINQQCKSALDTAKVCFVQASKGKKFAKEDTCSNFSFSGSGTKGTAELKKKLKQVKDACFEQSNQTVSTIKYDYADKVRTYEMDIKEKQEQIADANKALEAKKTENEAISKETDTQKSQEQKSLEEQMANFAEKLQNLQDNTNDALKTSNAIIEERNKQLDELKAGKLPYDLGIDDGGNMYDDIASEAMSAITNISLAGNTAYGACCVNATTPKPGGTKSLCSQLSKDSTSFEKQSKDAAKKQKVKDKTAQ